MDSGNPLMVWGLDPVCKAHAHTLCHLIPTETLEIEEQVSVRPREREWFAKPMMIIGRDGVTSQLVVLGHSRDFGSLPLAWV